MVAVVHDRFIPSLLFSRKRTKRKRKKENEKLNLELNREIERIRFAKEYSFELTILSSMLRFNVKIVFLNFNNLPIFFQYFFSRKKESFGYL